MLCVGRVARPSGAFLGWRLILLLCALGVPTAAQGRRPAPAGSRLLGVQGEVRIKRYPSDDLVPAMAPTVLARRDEIETRAGTAEIEVENGMVVELGEETLVAIIGRDSGVDLFLARGALRARPGRSGEVHSVHVVSGAGRLTLRGRDVRLRGDATSTTLLVHDGMASIWGRGGVVLRTGQMTQFEKGSPPQPPRPLPALAPPAWLSGDGLYLGGELPPLVTLRWQAAPAAARYRLELQRSDEKDHAPVVVETEATRAELRDLRVGAYAARLVSIDERGGRSEPGEPRRVIVAEVAGLSGGVLAAPAGSLPRVHTPTGMAATVQVDGAPLGVRGLPPGEHRLRVTLGGLHAEIGARVIAVPRPPQPPPAVATVRAPANDGPALARPPLLQAAVAPAAAGRDGPRGPSFTLARAPDAPPEALAPPEDALLLGPAEIPGGGVRSPWAGRLVQLRFESTDAGAARLMLHGRLTLRNGLGGEIGFSLLRAQLGTPLPAEAGEATSYGNLSALLRSPALRRGPFALQGVLGALFPISGSGLDRIVTEVPAGAAPLTLPPGGGWRLEAALLLGLRKGRFSLLMQQGLSLRLSDGFLPAYEGGAAVQADVVRRLRLLGLCQWTVNYLGVPLTPDGAAPDAGAAVGGGLELLLPGPLGGVRLALLGRAGVGAGGAAIYGRGTIGVQAGYRFR